MIWLAMLFGAAVFTSYIRDEYDAERWKIDPNYCRYGASFKEVFKWWWHR
jgi:hypothetical protein